MNVKLEEVFGIRTEVNDYSYIDRGGLDEQISKYAGRDVHIALRGESKSGKSWLRQKIFQNANIISCRLGFTNKEIYTQVLSNLDISLTVEKSTAGEATLSFKGSSEIGWSWLAKAKGEAKAKGTIGQTEIKKTVGHDELDFDFLSKVIKASGRRVIIEDFHYLSADVQRLLAHELKTFWDYGVYFVIVGVWHRKNYITYLNSDVAGRIREFSVYWSAPELEASITKGAKALNIEISPKIKKSLARDSFNNVGILQSLVLAYCDILNVRERQSVIKDFSNTNAVADAGMAYAEQIEAVYQLFSENVSDGIRKRKNSTQIYAYAMQTIVDATDAELIDGLALDDIYMRTNEKQSRIQKSNLRTILRKFREIQVDDRGKGLVLSFDDLTDTIMVVDRGLLFYRKYMTTTWPFERIIKEAEETNTGLGSDK
ncbi:hypothetical protein OA238_c43710 [Octadecabacter arcticus 238]|uniref:Uncharacterized protein n=1 Tax=Octadecabacter arcticus 238 TaxID=391616 RepID=M9RUQ2_9RHOB|nr:hypothetical protein [Octadecabacter arcticus]AGI74261.1 hypothetical protein OA238_c43710 [Octadecabacter arcticus 238]